MRIQELRERLEKIASAHDDLEVTVYIGEHDDVVKLNEGSLVVLDFAYKESVVVLMPTDISVLANN